MKLLRRIRNIATSNLNEMVACAEDPEKLLKQCISDMQDQAAAARTQTAQAIAAEKKLGRLVAVAEAEAERARTSAESAAAGDDESATREAVRVHLMISRRAEELHQQWDHQLESVGALKQALGELDAKIEEARRRKDVLVARKRLALAKRDLHSSIAGVAETNALLDSQAFEAFERVADQVDTAEAEAEAAADVCLVTVRPAPGSPRDVTEADIDAAIAALSESVPSADDEA